MKTKIYSLLIEKHFGDNGFMYSITEKNHTVLSIKSLRTMKDLLKEIEEIIQ